jgi:hypothetical protein
VLLIEAATMVVPITWDYKSVQVLERNFSDVRRKLLEHEAEDGWIHVGSIPIDDDDHLVSRNQVIDREWQ